MSYVYLLLSSALRSSLRKLTAYSKAIVKDIDLLGKIRSKYSFEHEMP